MGPAQIKGQKDTMGTPTVPADVKLITGEELQDMGDIEPCELIDGRIMPLSPTGGEHSILESILGFELTRFARQSSPGWVMSGKVGIYIHRDPDRIRAADMIFISKDRSSKRPSKGFLEAAPELVIEIVSPADRWRHIRQKLEDYFSIGVQWVWIIEPENRAILVYHSVIEMEKLDDTATLSGEGILSGFNLVVADLFAEA